MDGEITRLALATAVGSTLLTLTLLAATGPKRTLRIVRGAGVGGPFLALFVGTLFASLSASVINARPYTLAFLPTTVLRAQGLAEDPDLRTRYNVDPRLRYLPPRGSTVVNLEASYAFSSEGFRAVEIAPVVHSSRSPLPPGVVTVGNAEFGQEVDGLYDRAWATIERAGRQSAILGAVVRTEFLESASVGLLALGATGFLAGAVPLILRILSMAWDMVRLLRMTSASAYRGARGRAARHGFRELARWHVGEASPFASLATFGALVLLAGTVLGLLREDETQSLAHAVFREARDIRLEPKG